MKKTALIISISIHLVLNAQNSELKKIYNQIDSIVSYEREYYKIPKKAYKMFEISKYYGGIYDIRYSYGKVLYQPIKHKYEKPTLKYLERFMYDSLKNIRTVIYQLIYSLGINSSNHKIRQKVVNDLLNMALITNSVGYSVRFFNIEDFNQKAKNRLKEIIRGEKKEYEIEFDIKDSKIFFKNDKDWMKQAEYISKKDSLPYKYVRDSLLNIYVKDAEKYFREEIYGYWFILLTGRLYMYDFVPELEAMLKNKKYEREIINIKYALARMGNTQYEDELLKLPDPDYVYIHTQKSAWAYIRNLYRELPEHQCYSEAIGLNAVPGAYFIVSYAQTWILNFPDKYKVPDDLCLKRFEIKAGKYQIQLKQAKKWFKENKGKYELDPNIW